MPDNISFVQEQGIFAMILASSPFIRIVLLILIVLSVCSWAITIAKFLQFRRAKKDSDEFGTIFWETRNFARIEDSSRRLINSPLAQVFISGFRELNNLVHESEQAGAGQRRADPMADLHTVERALKRSEYEEGLKLEQGTTFLASVASSAPFIGLFGTVWGIMNAFQGLSQAKSSTIQAVAPGISEALVATAIGLLAAIPAAIAYNYFAVSVRHFRESMDKFSSEFIDVARRYFVK